MIKINACSIILLALGVITICEANANTLFDKSISRGRVVNNSASVNRALVRPTTGSPRYGNNRYFLPPTTTGFRYYLPQTSQSSVDITVAEFDPPRPPAPTGCGGADGDEGDEPRGTKGP